MSDEKPVQNKSHNEYTYLVLEVSKGEYLVVKRTGKGFVVIGDVSSEKEALYVILDMEDINIKEEILFDFVKTIWIDWQ